MQTLHYINSTSKVTLLTLSTTWSFYSCSNYQNSTYLPSPNTRDSLSKWSLESEAEFEGITANFYQIIYESTECGHGKC